MRKKNFNIKKFVLINSIIIFLFGFITHNLYSWLPSFLTTIFPVNESLYEHLKMIFITPLIVGVIIYIIAYYKKINYSNYFFSLYLAIMANIVIFFVIYLPIYYRFGHSMIITLIIYFISILISQYIHAIIITKTKDILLLNVIGIIMLVTNYVILLFFTYNPLEIPFFFDTENEVYGIYK